MSPIWIAFIIAAIIITVVMMVVRRKVITPTTMDNDSASWHEFYRKYFGLVVDFSNVHIPDNPDNRSGFDRIIFIPKGLKLNDVLKAMTKAGIKWWTYISNDDLDKAITKNDRQSTKAYAIRCRERVEADEELKNLSADDLKAKGINCMTLLERAVYGFKYFSETGKHLDIVNWTLCAGSRLYGGRVPDLSFDPRGGEVYFDRWDADDSDGYLRARQVVSY